MISCAFYKEWRCLGAGIRKYHTCTDLPRRMSCATARRADRRPPLIDRSGEILSSWTSTDVSCWTRWSTRDLHRHTASLHTSSTHLHTSNRCSCNCNSQVSLMMCRPPLNKSTCGRVGAPQWRFGTFSATELAHVCVASAGTSQLSVFYEYAFKFIIHISDKQNFPVHCSR